MKPGKVSISARTGHTLDKMIGRPSQAKISIFGDYKTGKTSLALSTVDHAIKKKYRPKDTMFAMIDLDGGTLPLVKKGAVPSKWQSVFYYELCNNFPDVVKATKDFLPDLVRTKRAHGQESAWIIIDNMKNAWQWVRDDHAVNIYGMHEFELAAEKRKEALHTNRKTLPTFDDRRFDYGILNPKHNQWVDSIILSGVNVIFIMPESSWEQVNEDKTKTTKINPSCQKDLLGRVDEIIRTRFGSKREHLADLWGSRNANRLFRGMPDPTYTKIRKWIDKNSGDVAKKVEEDFK